MSMKKLFGLDSLPLTDCELMGKLTEARRRKQEQLEFQTARGKVVINITSLRPDGLMQGSYRMYK